MRAIMMLRCADAEAADISFTLFTLRHAYAAMPPRELLRCRYGHEARRA